MNSKLQRNVVERNQKKEVEIRTSYQKAIELLSTKSNNYFIETISDDQIPLHSREPKTRYYITFVKQ